MYKESFAKINYFSIFDNLGSMLTNLYTIDLIILENTAFQDYWQTYNQMFEKVQSNLGNFTIEKKMLRRIQRFCSRLYSSVINGKLY